MLLATTEEQGLFAYSPVSQEVNNLVTRANLCLQNRSVHEKSQSSYCTQTHMPQGFVP